MNSLQKICQYFYCNLLTSCIDYTLDPKDMNNYNISMLVGKHRKSVLKVAICKCSLDMFYGHMLMSKHVYIKDSVVVLCN